MARQKSIFEPIGASVTGIVVFKRRTDARRSAQAIKRAAIRFFDRTGCLSGRLKVIAVSQKTRRWPLTVL